MPPGPPDPGTDVRIRARNALLRRTRGAMAAAAAAAIALSGLLTAVAAQAFKGHQSEAGASARPTQTQRVHVPAPERIPAIAGQPPLQPPPQPPAAATPDPTPQAPVPQVSGGS